MSQDQEHPESDAVPAPAVDELAELIDRHVEWRTWEALRDQACAEHAGRWAVFKGTAVTGYWDAYEEALTAGYLLHGLEPFLVLHVAEVDTIHHILT